MHVLQGIRPQQGPDRQQKKRGGRAQAEEKARGSCSRRPRTRERGYKGLQGNQGKETRKKKRIQVEYRVEGA